MRRLVVATIVVALALTLAGCGGGEEEPAATETPATTQPVATASSGQDDPEPIADRSGDATEAVVPMSTLPTMPAEVAEGIANKQAMILFFYNTDQRVTNDTRKQVDKVAEDNTGLVDLLTYDLGKSTSMDDEGVVEVDSAVVDSDPAVQEAITFAREMKVTGTPFTFVIDDQGNRIYAVKGYIDADLLGRQVERATR